MEYSLAAKINKSPKEKKALIEAPPMSARSLYAKSLGKNLKTKETYKNEANEKSYADVEKKHGKKMTNVLKDWHSKNETDEGDFDAFAHLKKAHGGKINLKNCVVNTAENKNPKHKKF